MNQQLPAAVLASFCDLAIGKQYERLQCISEREWRKNLYWLDASGLALYFLRRLKDLEIAAAIPPAILKQLEQRHADNKEKTAGLISEFVRLNAAFQGAGLRYVNLKGLTLVPDSCADPTLRFQTDLDFLIVRTEADRCRQILGDHGYSMLTADAHVMEFKSNTHHIPNIRDLYKAKPQSSVELHLCDDSCGDLQHDQVQYFVHDAVDYPALSPDDIFLSQACHLYRHLRSEWTRVSWLLEFRYFILNQCNPAWWRSLQLKASGRLDLTIAIGVAIAFAEKAFGKFAPEELTSWTVKRLPPSVALWIEHFGSRILFTSFPGSKLYLILEQEVANCDETSNAIRRRLFPRRRPNPILIPAEGTFARIFARWQQSRYLFFRLRFHATRTAQYFWENRRWRRVRRRALAGNFCGSTEFAASAAE